MDKKCKDTFDNYDYENRHNRIAPNSPCPVLYGIRSDDPNELIIAKGIVKSEHVAGWMIFETNQGTDDHIERKKIKEIKQYQSVVVEGRVINKPFTIPGGHVIFTIENKNGDRIDCAAYEPTKRFRDIVRKLRIGDIIDAYGGVRENPFTINLEKIEIKHLIKVEEKIENPICPRCGKHMKSLGKEKGYRCIKCGFILGEDAVKRKVIEREINMGFYEVPVCARRHLSKPLKRMNHNPF